MPLSWIRSYFRRELTGEQRYVLCRPRGFRKVRSKALLVFPGRDTTRSESKKYERMQQLVDVVIVGITEYFIYIL